MASLRSNLPVGGTPIRMRRGRMPSRETPLRPHLISPRSDASTSVSRVHPRLRRQFSRQSSERRSVSRGQNRSGSADSGDDDLDGLDLSALPAPEPGCFDEGEDYEEEEENEQPEEDAEDDSFRVTTVCSCRKLDEVRLPELLSARLGKTYRWKHGKETIYVPFSEQLVSSRQASVAVPEDQRRPGGEGGLAPLRRPMLQAEAGLRPEPIEPLEPDPGRCVIFFQYGVVVMWGLTWQEEQDVLENIVSSVAIEPLQKNFVEREKLQVTYCNGDRFNIRDDIMFLPRRLQKHVGAILSIAHALAQSTKLCVFEEQGSDLVRSTENLPWELARKGKVSMTHNSLFKLVGRLFVHKSEVDKLSSVLNTPEYFWHAPDALQELYKEVCRYLEVEERTEAINSHLEVTQCMLDMLQSRHDASHGVFLEWVVIVLVAIEAVIGVLEFCGTIGLIPPVRGPLSFASRLSHAVGHAVGGEHVPGGCEC